MVTCPRCGAGVNPSALVCPYCQTQTYYGQQQAERQAAYQYQAAQTEQAQLAAERQSRQQALSKKAQHALYWSLAGTFTCCFPAAVVGVVMGLNVKGVAKREGAVAPSTSTVAVVLGCCAVALFCVGVLLYVQDSREKDARIASLQAQTEAARSSEAIAQPLGCALTELHLLQEGYADKSGISIAAFQCDGKLEQNGDRATLRDVRFRTSSTERHVLAACLVRGTRWSIKELRDDNSCEPRAAAAASAVPSTAASAP